MTKRLSKDEARRILAEVNKREKGRPKWEEHSFEAQWEFITDPQSLKAAQCTRRAGKSYGCGLYLVKTAIENPGVTCMYIAKTRESAKRIMIKDVLTVLNDELELNAEYKKQEMSFVFPNGSVIYLVGADNSENEMTKLLGQKFKLCIIDEAAFFQQDLRTLVYEVLKPACADLRGTIAMISTTSDLTKGLYYDVTNEVEAGWSVHKWSAQDNPHMTEMFNAEIAEMVERNPDIKETPAFKRMYMNEWVIDTDASVYRFKRDRNVIAQLPDLKTNERLGHKWHYVLGIDFGWNDPTAFVVMAYHPLDEKGKLYVLKCYKASNMVGQDIGDKVKEIQAEFPEIRIVVDPASKQLIEDIRARFGFHMISAEKTDKKGHIGIMNSDMQLGNLHLVVNDDNGVEELVDEYIGLIWDIRQRDRGRYVEHAACANHLADAALYAWRFCYAYVNEPESKVVGRAVSKNIHEVEAYLSEWEEAESLKIEQQKRGGVEVDFADEDEGW